MKYNKKEHKKHEPCMGSYSHNCFNLDTDKKLLILYTSICNPLVNRYSEFIFVFQYFKINSTSTSFHMKYRWGLKLFNTKSNYRLH